jgi:hypothetical protein
MLELLTEKDNEILNYDKNLVNKESIIHNLQNNLLSVKVMEYKIKVHILHFFLFFKRVDHRKLKKNVVWKRKECTMISKKN